MIAITTFENVPVGQTFVYAGEHMGRNFHACIDTFRKVSPRMIECVVDDTARAVYGNDIEARLAGRRLRAGWTIGKRVVLVRVDRRGTVKQWSKMRKAQFIATGRKFNVA